MMPNLTLWQRLVAVATAVIIAGALWVQIQDYGLGDTPWLIGLLTIAALLFIALAGRGKARTGHKDVAATAPKEITIDQAFSAAVGHIERFYDGEIKKQNNLKKLNDIKSHKAISVRKAAFMAVLLSMKKKFNGFSETRSGSELRRLATLAISGIIQFEEDIFRSALDSIGGQGTGNKLIIEHGLTPKEVGDRDATEIIGLCEGAVEQCVPLFFRDADFPIDPILAELNRVAPLADQSPEAREKTYAPTFRALFRVLEARTPVGIDLAVVVAPPQASNADQNLPTTLRTTVEGLIDQMAGDAALGQRPETMLTPRNRFKLDIIIAAYRRDMKRAISSLYDQQLGKAEIQRRARQIRRDVERMVDDLRREPRDGIELLFMRMFNQRTDIREIEREVRANHPEYKSIPPL